MIERALVLGAAGFVGRHVARALAANGAEVIGLGHGGWSRAEWQAWGFADFRATGVTIESMLTYGGEPDAIVQCAGSGSVAFSMTHPAQDHARNVGTTLTALEFARVHAPGCRIVLPSSAAVYGAVADLPIAIDAPLRPMSPYGVHKVAAEALCASYARHFALPVTIVRLFSIYGPGLRKQLLWDACRKITAGTPEFGGTGEECRDWLHVEDAAALLVAALGAADATCPVFNGGTGRSVSNRIVLARLAEALDGPAPRFTGVARGGDPDVYEADMAVTPGGWHPKRRIEEELAAYARWFTESGG